MKRITTTLVLTLCTLLSVWAASTEKVFLIKPAKTGTFTIRYSVYTSASTDIFIDWGDGTKKPYNSTDWFLRGVSGSVQAGRNITLYGHEIDYIHIESEATALEAFSEATKLKAVAYYGFKNLSSTALELLYNSLPNNGISDRKLVLSNDADYCKKSVYTSNLYRLYDGGWSLGYNENGKWTPYTKSEMEAKIIPTAEFEVDINGEIPDLYIATRCLPEDSWIYNNGAYPVHIKDANGTIKSLWGAKQDDDKGPTQQITGVMAKQGKTIKIYGASLTHLKVNNLKGVPVLKPQNLRYFYSNSGKITWLNGLIDANRLVHLDLDNNKELQDFHTRSTSLKYLRALGCSKLTDISFKTNSLEFLNLSSTKLPYNKIASLSNATKLKELYINNLGWDACTINAMYGNLPTTHPVGATIYVNSSGENKNDALGSNKKLANAKGWSVQVYDGTEYVPIKGNGYACDADDKTPPAGLPYTTLKVAGGKIKANFGAQKLHSDDSAAPIWVEHSPGSYTKIVARPNVWTGYKDLNVNNSTMKIYGQLSSLDLRNNGDNIKAVDASKNSYTGEYYLFGNNMDACAMDDFYRSLPTKNGTVYVRKESSIIPGFLTSKSSIATGKGWKIQDYKGSTLIGDGTGCNTVVSVMSVKLNKTTATLTVGQSETLTATVQPGNATTKTVTWSSSNPGVATVDNAGKVTAKTAGTATITVTTKDGGKTATCTVTVMDNTAVEETDAEMKFSLSPTVVTNGFTVTYKEVITETTQLEIYSLSGAKVAVVSITQEEQYIDVSSLSAGVYFVRLAGATSRIIKK